MSTPLAATWEEVGDLTGPQGPQGPAGADGGTTPHAARHAVGGTDPVTPASIGAPADADVVHRTGTETIAGQKTIPAGSTWIFNAPPQVAVGTAANHAVRRDDARLTDARAPLPSMANVANGWVQLDAGTLIPAALLPSLAITDVFPVSSQAAMLALTAQRGDVAVRSDLPATFILAAEPASTLANWTLLPTPTDAVLSVAGRTGAVTLAKADVGLGNVSNLAPADLPVSTATQSALDLKAPRALSVRTVAASGAIADSDDVVLVDTAGGTRTMTLPTAVGRAGRGVLLKKIGPNPLVIATTLSQTIDGLTSETISMMNGFREVVSDGANWYVRGGKIEPVIIALPDVAAAGTLTINAAAGTVYRARLMGSTATLAVPANPVDGDVINLELFAVVTCAVTIASGILLTGGLPGMVQVGVGNLWSAALRYRAATNPVTSPAAWRLLASSVDN